MNDEVLSGALQENVLTLLCFDSEACPVITSVVPSNLFESTVYRRIAERAAEYFRQYKKAAADHLPDLLEDHLSKDNRDRDLYRSTLRSLHELSGSINRTFVLDSLTKFVRGQVLRRSIIEAAEHIKAGKLDAAEEVIAKGQRQRVQAFDPGILLSKAAANLSVFDSQDELINSGIKALDELGICPAPGEEYVVMSPPNRGKTFALVHVGKFAALQRKKVLHLTLEMSQKKTTRRYLQGFFSLTKREADEVVVPLLRKNMHGELSAISHMKVRRRDSLTDPLIVTKVKKRAEDLAGRMQIMVKQFPTGQLTVQMLSNYLDMLRDSTGFIPDMIVVDYADLLKISADNVRVETGAVYRDLRGIAVERNLAMVTASQSNREGEDAAIINMKHFSEDYSKAMISDNVITYNQTKEELALGLARLFVAKGRDERKGQTILITQAYDIGQFCLDSVVIGDEYSEEMLKNAKATAPKQYAGLKKRGQNLSH